LDTLKQELTHGPLLNNIDEDQSAPFIYQLNLITTCTDIHNKTIWKQHQIGSKLKNSDDIFNACLDGVTIEDNGRLIIHNKLNNPVEIRGKNEYSSGIHQFRLQIEKNPLETWIFFGISQNRQTTGQFSHTHENDIILLIFDCDNRTISYTNERSQCSQKLNIGLSKCPFPWQLHINLFW
jgi:hypothetical protein